MCLSQLMTRLCGRHDAVRENAPATRELKTDAGNDDIFTERHDHCVALDVPMCGATDAPESGLLRGERRATRDLSRTAPLRHR